MSNAFTRPSLTTPLKLMNSDETSGDPDPDAAALDDFRVLYSHVY